jgi:hypothetical protein
MFSAFWLCGFGHCNGNAAGAHKGAAWKKVVHFALGAKRDIFTG